MNAWATTERLALLVCCLAAAGCGDPCAVENLGQTSSGSGRYVAKIQGLNCGATEPFVRTVSLSEATAEPGEDDWVFAIEGQSDISINWRGDGAIMISYSGVGKSPTIRSQWRDVEVRIR